jgi:chromosomal replication initiation ATPase DnaA
MNEPHSLAFEIRLLRQSIDLLREGVDEGARVVHKLAKERERIEDLLVNYLDPATLDASNANNAELRRQLKLQSKKMLYSIRDAVALQFNITTDELISRRRKAVYACPRFAFSHIAHRRLNLPSPAVARALGYCDHTTVLFGCKRAEELMASDSVFAENYNAVWTAVQAKLTPTSTEQH